MLQRKHVELAHGPVQRPVFRVLQWNVLADGLAQSGEFIKVTSKGDEYTEKVLGWASRLPMIVAELVAAEADILCVQEVTHFEQLRAQLAQHGYEGVYLQKQHLDRAPPDGSAVFYRTARFQPESEPMGTAYRDSTGATCSQGCLQLLLRDTALQRRLLVVTTHLKAKAGPSNEAHRISQVKQLLQLVQGTLAASSSSSGTSSSNGAGSNGAGSNGKAHNQQPQQQQQQQQHARHAAVEVVVCGDFNAPPDAASIQAMSSSSLPFQSVLAMPLAAGSTTLETGGDGATGGAGSTSATPGATAASTTADAPTPSTTHSAAGYRDEDFTTWKFRPAGEKKQTIDYIWFSAGGGLQPLRRWATPTCEEIGPGGLPCEKYPSDHLAVCCEFGWSQDGAVVQQQQQQA